MNHCSPSSHEIVEKFQFLQAQLRQRVQTSQDLCLDEQNVLVVPSLTLDQQQLQNVQGVHQYEERFLFSLTRLRNPRMRLVYVTSQPLHPSVIDYYLHLMPGIPFSHARDRLLLFSAYDASHKSLTEKILERPRLLERIAHALRPNQSYMVCFNATAFERELSVRLGIPLLASDPELLHWGTKSGSREIFAECEIPHADGSLSTWTVADLAEQATDLWERQPQLVRMVVKLNQGFSGEGNALLHLPEHIGSTRAERLRQIHHCLFEIRCQAKQDTWEQFSCRIPEMGAIVEAFIEGTVKQSPSVQGIIHPSGAVEVLSTHDQILGGPDGQIFQGCRFPANQAYRLQLQTMGMRIGENLAAKGALERFGVDFITVLQDSVWRIYGIEINLRRGGTTHPFMTLKLLTNGHYRCETGLFYSRQERPKFYIASDNLQKPQYRGLLPEDLMDIVAQHQLHFDNSTETGTVFHLMGCLSQFGKLGLTCIGNSPQQAQNIYDQVVAVLDAETQTSACS
ncbi:MAG: carboxylate-amine ligase [Oscillatoriales cyanobacterium RM2_1_1]|nr:carboxylate-amine ligase [Oscillatoriales cyanobacterium SM2_3_0]NJO44656.1 carboxylate-amine ligase [Oscillatoriales cyanobacterium RM2_1_1]